LVFTIIKVSIPWLTGRMRNTGGYFVIKCKTHKYCTLKPAFTAIE